MKHTRKMLSILLALVMVFALATTALAEGEVEGSSDTTYSLTITNTKTGHTYAVYQIFTGDISGTSPNYVLSNVKYGQNYIPNGKQKGDLVPEADLKAIDNADTFAQSVTLTGDVFKTVASTDSSTVISGLPAGYYLIKDQNKVTGQDAATKFILQVVGDTSVEVKSAIPAVEKKVKENEKTVSGTTDSRIPAYTLPSQYNDVADWNIGDDVPFQLIGTLPSNYDDYTTYKYVFHDKESSGLSFNESSVKVTVNSVELTNGTDYTVVTTGLTDGCTFEIQFTDLKAITTTTITKDSYIVVDYTSKLNSNAVIGLDGNPNEVYLEFSNNPNAGGSGDTGTTPKDEVIVFTYELDVTKVDGATKLEDGSYSKYLKDAEFVLMNSDKTKVAKITNGKFDGWVDDTGITKNSDGTYPADYTLKSGEDGKFSIMGLDAGTYNLKETKAPTGYNLLANEITFEIVATTANDQTWDGTASSALTALQIKVGETTTEGNTSTGTVGTTVENNAGTTLPSTGGIGTTIFYVLGSVLVIGAAVLLVTKKRMSDNA